MNVGSRRAGTARRTAPLGGQCPPYISFILRGCGAGRHARPPRYDKDGAVVGLNVKAMHTHPAEKSFLHLKHSKEIFLDLVDLAHTIDRKAWKGYVEAGRRGAGAVYTQQSDGGVSLSRIRK